MGNITYTDRLQLDFNKQEKRLLIALPDSKANYYVDKVHLTLLYKSLVPEILAREDIEKVTILIPDNATLVVFEVAHTLANMLGKNKDILIDCSK